MFKSIGDSKLPLGVRGRVQWTAAGPGCIFLPSPYVHWAMFQQSPTTPLKYEAGEIMDGRDSVETVLQMNSIYTYHLISSEANGSHSIHLRPQQLADPGVTGKKKSRSDWYFNLSQPFPNVRDDNRVLHLSPRF